MVGIGTIMVSTGVLSLHVAVRWVVVGIGTIMPSSRVLKVDRGGGTLGRESIRWLVGSVPTRG